MLHITTYCLLQLKLFFLKSVESLADPMALPGALLLGTDSTLGVTWGTSFLGFKASWQCTQHWHFATEMRTRHFGGEGAVPVQKAAKNPSNLSFLFPLLLSCCCTNIIPCSVTAVKEQKAVQVGGRDWLLKQCTACPHLPSQAVCHCRLLFTLPGTK